MRYIIAILLCTALQQVSGQIRTIIPASKMDISKTDTTKGLDYDVYLSKKGYISTNITFNLSNIPANATIDRAQLRLVLDASSETVRLVGEVKGEPHGITIRNKNKGNYQKGDDVLMTTDDPKLFAGIISRQVASTKELVLTIFTQQENKHYMLYNTTRGGSNNPANIPRLVIDYHPELKQSAWSGSYADAQHTSAGITVFGSPNNSIALKIKQIAINSTVKGLVFKKDKLLFTDEAKASTILHAIDPITGETKVVKNELDPPAYSPVISRDGYYYHVSAKKITRISLDDGAIKNWNIDVSNPLTLGRDGGIYLTTDTFVRAYTPPPMQKLLWQYDIGYAGTQRVRTSAVSLSNDDNFAYVLYGKEKETSAQLAAINVLTKQVKTIPLNLDLAEKAPMPVIVVNKSDYLYFIDGKKMGKKLYIFDKELGTQTIISRYKHVSMPVVSNNNVYVLADDKILQIKGNKIVDSVEVWGTLNADKIAADKDDNVYLLNRNNFILCSFKKGEPKHFVSLDINTESIIKDLLVAPDGSVYLATDSEIFAVRRIDDNPNAYHVLSLSSINNITYRATSLLIGHKPMDKEEVQRVLISKSSGNTFIGERLVIIFPNVTFENGTDNIVESSEEIIIQNGFHVEKGAVLSFKMGY